MYFQFQQKSSLELFKIRPIAACRFPFHLSSTSRELPQKPNHIATATSNHTMASTKPLTQLVARSRPTARLTSSIRPFSQSSPLYAFPSASLGLRSYATPSGPPPPGFRLPKPERWDESKESTLDKAGKYFLGLEMLRGMYVVLEQYFRPP